MLTRSQGAIAVADAVTNAVANGTNFMAFDWCIGWSPSS
jgi:hypothetical protein